MDQLSCFHILRVDSPVSPMIGSALMCFSGDLHIMGVGPSFLSARDVQGFRGRAFGSPLRGGASSPAAAFSKS